MESFVKKSFFVEINSKFWLISIAASVYFFALTTQVRRGDDSLNRALEIVLIPRFLCFFLTYLIQIENLNY